MIGMSAILVSLTVGLASILSILNPYDGSVPQQLVAVANPAWQFWQLQRGAYLVRSANCIACHTVRGGKALAGGRAIQTPFGAIYSSNVTQKFASRSALPIQQPYFAIRLARAVFPAGHLSAGERTIGRVESRRLSGAGLVTLQCLPHCS